MNIYLLKFDNNCELKKFISFIARQTDFNIMISHTYTVIAMNYINSSHGPDNSIFIKCNESIYDKLIELSEYDDIDFDSQFKIVPFGFDDHFSKSFEWVNVQD